MQSTGDRPVNRSWSTPRGVVVGLAAVAAVVLALGVLLYAGEVNLADALIFIASAAAGALVGIYVPRPEPDGAHASTSGGESTETSLAANGGEPDDAPGGTAMAIQLDSGLLAALVGIVLLGLLVFVLVALLPRATADLARLFHIGSLGLIVVTVALAVVAVASPPGKKQAWVLTAVVTAVLAFISSTASGLVVDRFTSHPTGPSPVATVKNYFSPTIKPPSVKNYFSPKVAAPTVKVELGSECTVYLVHLDELVDDEPHIADHLPGKSFPLDQGARACGFKRASEVDAIAAVLAAR